jgi:soluble lytic murein transglycosylase-like protein
MRARKTKHAALSWLLVLALWGRATPCGAQTLVARGQTPGVDRHAMFAIVGRLYGFDPELLEAIATVESNGDAGAVSDAGARGLMQLMPPTAQRFHVSDPFDPVQSALGAVRFLDYLRRVRGLSPNSAGGNFPQLLAAYNAGDGAVKKYAGLPPYRETRNYVRKVLLVYLLGSLSRPGTTQRSQTHYSTRPAE